MLTTRFAKISFIAPLFLSVIVITGYSIIILRIPLGFDWTDESFVLYLINHPDTPLQQPWGFQFLLEPFLWQGQLPVIGLRYIRLLLGLVAGVLVCLSILNLYSYKNKALAKSQIISIFAICQLATLVQWVFWPRYVSYNEWASFFIIVLIFAMSNLIFNYWPKRNIAFVKQFLWGLLIGVAFFGLFLARFSSVIIALLFLIVTFLAVPPVTKLVIGLSSLTGFICTLLISQLYTFDLSKYLRSIIEAVFSQNGMSDNGRPQNLLLFYIESIASPILVSGVLTILGVIVYQSPNLLKYLGNTVSKKFQVFLFTAGTTVVIFYFYEFKKATMDADVAGSQLLISRPGLTILFWLCSGISMLWASYLISNPKPDSFSNEKNNQLLKPIPIFLIVLGLAPIAASFGTNNTLINHASFGAWTWAGLLGIGFIEISGLYEDKQYTKFLLIPVITILVASVSTLQMFAYQLPYRTGAFKEMKSVVQNNGELSGLKISIEESEFVSAIDHWKNNHIDASSYVIALKSPGLAVLLGAETLGSPWLDSSAPSALNHLGKEICPLPGSKEIVVIFPKNQAKAELASMKKSLMNNCDLLWPTDFVKQEIHFPKFKLNGLETYIEIWTSKTNE